MRALGPSLVLLMLLSACASADPAVGPDENGAPPSATGPSTPGEVDPAVPDPALVGFAGVTLEPPATWRTRVYDQCTRVAGDSVVLRVAGSAGCDRPLSRARSWVTLEPLAADDSILLAMGRAPRLGEHRTRRTGLACRTAGRPHCDQAVAVPGLGVLVQLHLVGPRARAELVALRDSLASMDDGFVAVPPVPYGTEGQRALGILDDVGLRGRIPDVEWPHSVVGTEPPAGSVLTRGSVVDLRVGDG